MPVRWEKRPLGCRLGRHTHYIVRHAIEKMGGCDHEGCSGHPYIKARADVYECLVCGHTWKLFNLERAHW